MVTRAQEKEFPFLYLRDDKDAIYSKFGANKTPHVFVLDSELTVQYIGAIDDNAQDADNVSEHFVANAIAALEKGESPNPATTKAVGVLLKQTEVVTQEVVNVEVRQVQKKSLRIWMLTMMV